MDYEKAYKEALSRAKGMWEQGMMPERIEYIFPELCESEDEKIRKELITHCRNIRCVTEEGAEGIAKWIAWFEKQGEQKTEIKYVYPKFRIGDVIEPIKPNGFYRPVRVLSIEKKTESYYCESDDKKSFSSIPIRCEDEYKLVEQKPTDKVELKFEKE